MGRSWGCVFFGHEWLPVFNKKTVPGFGVSFVVSHYICVKCEITRDS